MSALRFKGRFKAERREESPKVGQDKNLLEHQVIPKELSTSLFWFLGFIWCFIKTNRVARAISKPWKEEHSALNWSSSKSSLCNWRPLPSSVTHTKGLWDCWPSVLAWAPVVGVMLSPADPRHRCAGAPQQHTLAGFPGCRPELRIPKQHASLLHPLLRFLHRFSLLPSSFLVFYLGFSPCQMNRHWNSERRIFIRLKHQEMSQHGWRGVLDISRCLWNHLEPYHPYCGQQSVPSHLCSAHLRCENFSVQNANEFVPIGQLTC